MANTIDGLNQYLLDSINTATPEKLALMLYEGALKNVRECRLHRPNDPGEALAQSQLSRDILSALADDVNMQHPHGVLMRNLYLFCWRQVLQATTENRPDDLMAVEEVLGNLISGLERYGTSTSVNSDGAAIPTSINFAG